MNLSTLIAEIALERQLNINRYIGSLQNDVAKLMYDLSLDIEDLFRGDLTDFKKSRLNELYREINSLAKETFGVFSSELFEQLPVFAADEAAFAADMINDAAGFSLATRLPPSSVIERLAREVVIESVPMSDWISRNQGSFLFNTQQAIRIGIGLSETNGQIMRRIRQSTDMRQIAKDGSTIGVTTRNLNSIVRTAVQEISSGAHLATYEVNGDVIKSLSQLSTLDSRTTDRCMAYSGKVWDLKTREPIGHKLPFVSDRGSSSGTPRHFGCRSRIVPVTKSFSELGIDLPELPKSTRSSMDGQVAEDLSFEDFLKKKGKQFTESALGKGRAELYLEKKISLADLLDASGNPLTLAELRQKHK